MPAAIRFEVKNTRSVIADPVSACCSRWLACSLVISTFLLFGARAQQSGSAATGGAYRGTSSQLGVAGSSQATGAITSSRPSSALSSANDPRAVLPARLSERNRLPQGLPGTLDRGSSLPTATADPGLPRVFVPSRPRMPYTRYPWKRNIIATVFWVGERPTANNPTPNHMSSWDTRWVHNFGGYDNPDPSQRTSWFTPRGFVPGLNPFYIALPYNDVESGGMSTKSEAPQVIPWFAQHFKKPGHTVLRGRWVAIRIGSRTCFAQWEDCGPFETDDWPYVFGERRPKTRGNGGAGIDVSPAVRDYLGMGGKAVCDWRFVDLDEVPDGPWKRFGANNPFATDGGQSYTDNRAEGERALTPAEQRARDEDYARIIRLREMRDAYIRGLPLPH